VTSPWEIAKDGLGLLGAAAMAIPWLRDFFARQQRDWLRSVPVMGALADTVGRRVENMDERIRRAKRGDFYYMIFGLLLLALSFAISLWRGLFAAS